MYIRPTLEEFECFAKKGNLIPVYAEFSSDSNTPVAAYNTLRGSGNTFLFESAERTGMIGRYSFIGIEPKKLLEINGKDPLVELKTELKGYHFVANPSLSHFCGGMVGYLGYDCVRFFERHLNRPQRDDLALPESLFMLVDHVVAFDHLKRTMKIIAVASIEGDIPAAYQNAADRIRRTAARLHEHKTLTDLQVASVEEIPAAHSNMTQEHFCESVARSKKYIIQGDIIQVVLSQRFQTPYTGDILHLYRTLWLTNPSPYMFCIEFAEGLSLVGSSPEVHVRLTGKKVEIRPIAGTRKRGITDEEDARNAENLREDPKEKAEHVMLVDLARNDIGRIATFGTVQVKNLMEIEKFSHVMHMVTDVEGKLVEGKDMFDLMRATFPAGTVSGAPKVRAMQIIEELEGNVRGVYAGAVGYFGFDGNMDSCIALRTAVIKNGTAFVQAGAGIVYDSTPEGEYHETVHKAKGLLRAIASAHQC